MLQVDVGARQAMARAFHQSMQRYPLSVIMSTDAGVRLPRELALHGGLLAAPDLARRTGLSKASVARGLAALEGSGAFRSVGSGRSVLYGLSPDPPLAPAIQGLFEAESARFRDLLEGARNAARSAGPDLVALWLYGSVARGGDGEDSDVDFALIFGADRAAADGPDRRQELADAFRDEMASLSRTAAFTPSLVVLDTDDVARLASERDPWWTGVLADAQALVGEAPEAMATRIARHPRRFRKVVDRGTVNR